MPERAAPVAKRDWSRNRDLWVRVLETRTGDGVATWMRRIRRARPADAGALRAWLAERDVTGYAQALLVMECFGYPDFVVAPADALVDAQYADRPALRPVFDAIVEAAAALGEVALQARKTYVSFVGPRRTFARAQAATRGRVDLGLRLEAVRPAGRLRPSTIHPTMRVRLELATPDDLDDVARGWLRRAYEESC